MKKGRSSTEMLNVDVLALSLLCCLLASVVGVLVLGGDADASPKQPPPDASQDTTPVWTALHDQTAKLYARVQEVEHTRKPIVEKLNYSVLQRANMDLESRINEIQQKLNLIDKIQASTLEVARLRKELENLENKTNAPPTQEMTQILGEYKGPYVLVECIEDGAIIYPGKRRIQMNPSDDQLDQLLDQITKAGFVALVVRPEGWYGNSYDKLRKVIYDRLDLFEKNEGKHVGRSTFPLTSDGSITDFLPPVAKP